VRPVRFLEEAQEEFLEQTKSASTILLLTRFKPAICGGRPCRMEFPLLYEFKVQ
jgi:hypothetical protein